MADLQISNTSIQFQSQLCHLNFVFVFVWQRTRIVVPRQQAVFGLSALFYLMLGRINGIFRYSLFKIGYRLSDRIIWPDYLTGLSDRISCFRVWQNMNSQCLKEVWWSIVVSIPASRSPVPGSNVGPGGASSQCAPRGGSSHCNTV